LPGVLGGSRQCPRRALAEPRREQGRSAELRRDEVTHLIRIEQDCVEQLGRVERGATVVQPVHPGVRRGVGQPQDDAVVGRHRLDVEPVRLTQPGRHGQRPGAVDRSAVGAVDDHAPVADLVAEPLDEQGSVVGDVPCRLALLVEVAEQVVGRPFVEASRPDTLSRGFRPQPGHLADESPNRGAELGRAPERVTLPERQPRGHAGSGCDEYAIVGDVLDPPRRRTEREHVAHPRLVHHLLVQLAHPTARRLGTREEDAEEAPVGDRAAGSDRQPLGAAAAGERAGDAVPDHARAQLGELVRRVPAAQHVEHRLEHRAAQPREGR